MNREIHVTEMIILPERQRFNNQTHMLSIEASIRGAVEK